TTFDHEARRALREQAVVEVETRSPFTGRWADNRLYPSEAGLSIYVHDITERKRAEEELRRRAEQQALVAELGRRALASHEGRRSRAAPSASPGAPTSSRRP